MEDELLFETPNGSVITETEAKSKYGDRFQGLLDGGTFKQTDKPLTQKDKPKEEVKINFDIEAFYISPNGSEITGADVVKKYGNRSQSLVDDGTLKKKDSSVDSTGGMENTGGTTPVLEIPDTLLESGGLLNNNTELNSIMVGEVPFSQLSPQDQQSFYEEIERLEKVEKQNKAIADNPYGVEAKIPLKIEGLEPEKGQDPIIAAAQELHNKKYAPTDFSKLINGVEDTEKKDSSNRIDLLKNFQDSKGNTNLSFTEDGKIVGNRQKIIGNESETKKEKSWFDKLMMSSEEAEEIEKAKTINPELLSKMDIDVSDYQAWEDENTKEDGYLYQQTQDLLNTDTDNDYLNDKRNFKKLSAYINSMGNEIENDLSVIENKLLFETNKETRRQLLNTQSKLKAQQIKNISKQYNIISLFPSLENSEDAKQNRREQYIIDQRNGDVSGGFGNAVLKTGFDSGVKFLGGILSAIPSWVEQGGNLAGYEMPALRALNESLDSVLNNEIATFDGALDSSPVERRTVESLKEVTITWKGKPLQVGITPEGDIVDTNTMVSMAGILSNEEVKEVNELAKKVPNYSYEWSAGSVTQGLLGTAVNLIGLIKGGKWATKTIQKGIKKAGLKSTVPGGLGMGAVSYMSTVAGEVTDIKNQLMEAGVPEEEAMSRAIMYGNGRASLDGIFSGLAGGNTKLLEATKSFPKILKDLALKPKTVVNSKVFQDKVKDLVKENAKELFVEELPVLFTGNILNGLANDAVGREILNESTSDRDILETVILTIGATSGIGSKKLLSNNKRKDLVRAATQSTNIEKDIAELVNSGQMSVADAKSVYQEIYNMQTALNQTQGSVVMSGNQEEAAALLNQRRKLMDQRSNLEGPLKEDIDKKIEDVDKQIEVLKAEDTLQAREASGETNTETELEKEDRIEQEAKSELLEEGVENPTEEQIKNKKDAIQERQTEEEVLPDDGSSEESESTDNVELQGVGEGNTRPDAPQGGPGKPTKVKNEDEQDEELVVDEEVRKERVDNVVDDVITKTRQRNNRRGNKDNKQSEADNAIKYLEQSKLFNESNDSEQEAMVQAINKKLGVQIPSPTKRQIDAKKNKKKINNVDEAAALKDQIKLEVKAAKDSKKDQTTRRKALSDAINNLKDAGTISLDKAKSLIKKISGVNLNNSRAVAQVLDYVTKVNNDAGAVKKLKDADNLRKRIKRQLKNKKAEGTVSTAVEAFLRIDPNLVNDIDAYNAQAKIVSEGLNKTKPTKDGGVKVAETVDINAINEFTEKAKKEQTRKLDKAAAESFRDLTGLNSNEFTLEEMRAIISEQKFDDSGNIKGDKGKKADLVKKGIKKAFSVYQGIVDGMINNKVDPFTGEPINLSSKDLNTIKEFMNIDLDLLTNKQAMEVLDAMVNFSTNPGATGGMESMIAMDKGNKGTVEALKQDLIGKPLGTVVNKWAVKSWNNFLSSLPNLTINVFGGQSRARLFDKLSGFSLIKNGAAKAEKVANDIASAYESKFIQINEKGFIKGIVATGKEIKNIVKDQTKTMPNGERFDSAANDTERGLFAYMRRTINGTKAEQKAEFNRRKGLVEKTIERLANVDPKKSELYQNAYDKLVKGSDNINDIDAKVDPINKEAVEWITAEWSKLRPELENTSLNVYNRTLGKDLNYSPDSFSKIEASETEAELGEPVFNGTRENIYDKETGVLMEKRPGNNLPEGRFLNLGFDSNNINSLKDAITDVETAPGVQQLKAFVANPNYKKIIPTLEDRKLMNNKFRTYINAKRGISNTDKLSEGTKTFLTTINKVAGLAVSRVLGGPTQALKQLTPIVNTMTNLITDPKALISGLKLSANTDVNSWLNNSGFAIANRGIQSITNLNGLDNKISQAIEGKGFVKGLKKFAGVVDTLQKSWLENFLVKPDAYAARASWMAYYVSDLKKQGIDPAGIDWKNHKPNKRAGEYAQQQVDIQQNTSDQDLQGELFSSKNPGNQVLRKVAFPFANFLLNQKTRMYTNTNTLLRKGSTVEDRVAAGKSLVGLGVETATFNAIGLMVTQLLAGLSFEDEDDKEKALANRVKGRIGNVVKDVMSPIPILDDTTVGIANKVLALFQDAEDPKDVYQLFVNDKRTLNQMLGTIGIPITKGQELLDMMEMSIDGTYKNKYSGKETKLTSDAQDKMSTQTAMYFLYLAGLLPSEVGSVVNYNVKALKKLKESSGGGIPIKRTTKPKKKTKKRKSSGGPLLGNDKKSGGSLF